MAPRILARNLVLLREAEEAIAALERRSVPVLVVKGAALLGAVYELDERAMEDVDLLVLPPDRARAIAALEQAGFARVGMRDRPLGNLLHHACAFARDPGFPIDLHTAVAYPPRFALAPADLFARSVPWELAGETRARRPDGADLLLWACVHAIADELTGDGRLVADVERLAQRGDLDWDELAARARRSRCAAALWLALRHARLRGAAAVPEPAERRLAPGRLRRAYLERLLALDAETPYRFAGHGRRLRQALMAPATTDDPWRLAAALTRFGALRAADAAVSRILQKGST